MIPEFRLRFPAAQVECSAAENSSFFHRSFDAVIAWGLLFLLPPETQASVIRKAAQALFTQRTDLSVGQRADVERTNRIRVRRRCVGAVSGSSGAWLAARPDRRPIRARVGDRPAARHLAALIRIPPARAIEVEADMTWVA